MSIKFEPHTNLPLPKIIKDISIFFMAALLLFFPIVGLPLSGFTFTTHLWRPIIVAVMVALARLLLLLFTYSRYGKFSHHIWHDFQHRMVTPKKPIVFSKWLYLIGFVFLVVSPLVMNSYVLSVAILVLLYALLGLGLNIVVGLAGLLDLGFVAFYAIGAYTYAIGAHYFNMSFWLALPCGALLAAIMGTILAFPVLRMHGDYLAIVTLGFGEIIRLLLTNLTDLTGGPNGLEVAVPSIFGLALGHNAPENHLTFADFFGLTYSSSQRYTLIFIILVILICGMIFLTKRLRCMPLGRAWEAIREDEVAARSLGIHSVTCKLAAFSMGAMTGGLAGVCFAAYIGFINPNSFTFLESAMILAIVILGGMGSTIGVLLAAAVLNIFPEILREFSDYRMLIFGAVMVVTMVVSPQGLLPQRRAYFDLDKK